MKSWIILVGMDHHEFEIVQMIPANNWVVDIIIPLEGGRFREERFPVVAWALVNTHGNTGGGINENSEMDAMIVYPDSISPLCYVIDFLDIDFEDCTFHYISKMDNWNSINRPVISKGELKCPDVQKKN